MKFKIHRERPDIIEACDKLIGIMTSPEWMEALKDGHASVDSLVFEVAEEYSAETAANREGRANAMASFGDDTRIILIEKDSNAQQTLPIDSEGGKA